VGTKKIISYNLNGIRSAMRKDLIKWLETESPDIFMIQESKAQKDQVQDELAEFEKLGYNVYWHHAEKKGYSGVATFSKEPADFSKAGIGKDEFDSEGRLLRTDFGELTILNSYFPSGTTGSHRQDVKEAYLEEILEYLAELKKERKKIILSGDYNICHQPIDINNPQRHKKTSGFLPNEREWMDRLLESGFKDSFRMFCDEAEQYSWWSYRAGSRARNKGWRIDYHMVSENISKNVTNATILQSVVHSDHCPVVVEIENDVF